MAATVSTPIFEAMRNATSEIHQRTLDHPTVRGIGEGTLPDETFRFYLEQDYQFLQRFVRVLSITASAAPDLETMSQLSRLVMSTVDTEIEALRQLYESFSGDRQLLDKVRPAPTCEAYCNHLLACVHERDLLIGLAAILPCHWGYFDIGLHLKGKGLPADGRFAAWINEYASEEYGELVDVTVGRFNELGQMSSSNQREAAARAFDLSCRYELGFWEMAWTRETWLEGSTSD